MNGDHATGTQHIRSVLIRGSACTPRDLVFRILKEVTERLSRHVGYLANIEMTNSFEVLGDSPIGQYNHRVYL